MAGRLLFPERNPHNVCNSNLCCIWWISNSCTLNKIFDTHWSLKVGSYIFHVLLSITQSYGKQTLRHIGYVLTVQILLRLWFYNVIVQPHTFQSICSFYKSLFNYCNAAQIFLTLLHKSKPIWLRYSFGWFVSRLLKDAVSTASGWASIVSI
jgi:hypothetical protein